MLHIYFSCKSMAIKQKTFGLLLALLTLNTSVIANKNTIIKTTTTETNKKDTKMERHHNINYLEIPSKDIRASKTFFSTVFGWTFIDYGPEYSSFTARGIDGGFFTSKETVSTKTGSPLIVLYSNELEATQTAVEHAGGSIIEPIFSFPGGRRFHFTDTTGNEYAVWSE